MGIMPIKPKRRILFHTKDLVAERDTLRTRCERLEKEKAEWERLAKKNAFENGYNSAKISDLEQVMEKARKAHDILVVMSEEGIEAVSDARYSQVKYDLGEALAKLDKPIKDLPDDKSTCATHDPILELMGKCPCPDCQPTCAFCLDTKEEESIPLDDAENPRVEIVPCSHCCQPCDKCEDKGWVWYTEMGGPVYQPPSQEPKKEHQGPDGWEKARCPCPLGQGGEK